MSCRSPAAREISASRADLLRSAGVGVFPAQESALGRRIHRAWRVACGLRAAARVRGWRHGWRRTGLGGVWCLLIPSFYLFLLCPSSPLFKASRGHAVTLAPV